VPLALAHPRRAQNLLAGCIFVGLADKSAFAFTFGKVTKPQAEKKGCDFIRRMISAIVGKGSVNHNS